MTDLTVLLTTTPTALRAAIEELPRFTYAVQTGIYFLFAGPVVVYVGQGLDVHARVGQHLRDGQKEFDAYAFLPCPAARLNEAEAHFIHVLQPRYNHTLPANDTYKSIPSIQRLLGISRHVLNRYMRHRQLPLAQPTYPVADFAGLRTFIAWLQATHPRVTLRQCPIHYWEQYLREGATGHQPSPGHLPRPNEAPRLVRVGRRVEGAQVRIAHRELVVRDSPARCRKSPKVARVCRVTRGVASRCRIASCTGCPLPWT